MKVSRIRSKKKMTNDPFHEKSLVGYTGSIPELLAYQIFITGLLQFILAVLRRIAGGLLWVADRPAVTSGDLPYLMRTWQGWILLLLGLLAIFFYILFDVNGMVIMSFHILHQEKKTFRQIVRETFRSLRYFGRPETVLAAVYITFLAPLCYFGFNISLTKNFYVPHFIMAVIQSYKLVFLLYILLMVALFIFGMLHIFTFHYAIIGHHRIDIAARMSRETVIRLWANLVKRIVGYGLRTALLAVSLAVVLYFLPIVSASLFVPDKLVRRWLYVFLTLLFAIGCVVFVNLVVPFSIMKVTQIYESYTVEDEGEQIYPRHRIHLSFWLGAILVVVTTALGSIIIAEHFDECFPAESNLKVVGHRVAGIHAAENTAGAVKVAARLGADACETDVQRTKDGAYIINHDKTFKRVCGVNKTPDEMTLEEIRALRLNNYSGYGPEDGE